MRSLLEGLRHSAFPCARVLSVAGFFTILTRFPLGWWFIPEVKEAPLLGEKAGTVGRTLITVNGTRTSEAHARSCREDVHTGRHREAYIPPGYTGRYIPGGVPILLLFLAQQ